MENHRSPAGIGLGSELSQLMALAVLDGIDHWSKEKAHAKYYVRYMDDSVALFETKEEAQAYIKGVIGLLAERGLTASPKKTLVFPIKNGITFLGWRYILKTSGRIIAKPKKGKIAKTKRKLRRMAKAGVPFATIKESLDSSIASLEYGNATKEINELKRFLKEELMDYTKTTKETREIGRAAKAAEAALEPMKDDVETHREINERIGKEYSTSDQLALFRKTLKKLLDKAAITDVEFNAFNDYCEAMVAEVKSSKRD